MSNKAINEVARLKQRLKILEEETQDVMPTPQDIQAIEMDGKYLLSELREMCKKKGLSTSGDKKKLAGRLIKEELNASTE